jgi:methylenetetrahydrofolate dehydrogenase (NADP+)/methenyltetrahydrofolate cyclohydrolase
VTARALRGAPIVTRLRADLLASSRQLRRQTGRAPTLATLLVGRDPAAEAYRRAIDRSVAAVEIVHRQRELDGDAPVDRLVAELGRLNADPAVDGILVLMPLPEQLPAALVQEYLAPLKDVDGITPTNAGRLHLGLPSLRPSTPQGGIEILDFYGLDLAGKEIVVVGRSNVVGRPLATLLTQRDATVTLCHRQTRHLADVTRRADIVAVAAGHPGLIRGEMLRPKAVVIDFGVNVVGERIVGDTDTATVAEVASAYTPVPGGTGPVTNLVLAQNTIAAGFAALGGGLDGLASRRPVPATFADPTTADPTA